MTLLLLLLLTRLHTALSTSNNAAFVTDHFEAVRSAGGKTSCPVDSSGDSVLLRPGNVIQCGTQCKSNAACAAFSFTKQSGQCTFYWCNVPTNLTVVQGCSTFTRALYNPPLDCSDLMKSYHHVDGGLYRICIPSGKIGDVFYASEVYCDMSTTDGGWTVIQRREDGSVSFTRSWAEYAAGFGNKLGEYWLGLDTISRMTTNKRYKLRFDMSDFDGNSRYEEYDNFVVANASNWYKLLSTGTPNGTAGDSLTFCPAGSGRVAIGMNWTTYDARNDNSSPYWPSCAIINGGGWWFNNCHCGCPNGLYIQGPETQYGIGINWQPWLDYYYSMKLMAMKIKPHGT